MNIPTKTDNTPLSLNIVNLARMMDVMAKHYGIGLNGQWGKFSGAEAIMHHAYNGGESDEVGVDDFVALLESGLMVYDASMGDEPPKLLNAALKDAIKKIDRLKVMHEQSAPEVVVH